MAAWWSSDRYLSKPKQTQTNPNKPINETKPSQARNMPASTETRTAPDQRRTAPQSPITKKKPCFVKRQALNCVGWIKRILNEIRAQSRLKEQGDCAFRGDDAMKALHCRLDYAHRCLVARAKEARELFMWSVVGEIYKCLNDQAFVKYASMGK